MKTRTNGRLANQLRPLTITRHYTCYAEGAVLVCLGNTQVICTASVAEGVPKFLKDSGQGWLTAEYGMLPRATHTRTDREAVRGKQSGRTMEIQRLIGRVLRAQLNLKALGNYTITVDCDVIQADGGTRTAAITGASVAVWDAVMKLSETRADVQKALLHRVAAVSVGIIEGTPMLDLEYTEDSCADTDMNVVMTEQGGFLEVQGTAEGAAFSDVELQQLLSLARQGITEMLAIQAKVLML